MYNKGNDILLCIKCTMYFGKFKTADLISVA